MVLGKSRLRRTLLWLVLLSVCAGAATFAYRWIQAGRCVGMLALFQSKGAPAPVWMSFSRGGATLSLKWFASAEAAEFFRTAVQVNGPAPDAGNMAEVRFAFPSGDPEICSVFFDDAV